MYVCNSTTVHTDAYEWELHPFMQLLLLHAGNVILLNVLHIQIDIPFNFICSFPSNSARIPPSPSPSLPSEIVLIPHRFIFSRVDSYIILLYPVCHLIPMHAPDYASHTSYAATQPPPPHQIFSAELEPTF